MGWGVCTVSATEMVSFRSLRSVATSLTMSRSSGGGKLELDIVDLDAEIGLEYGLMEVDRRVRRRVKVVLNSDMKVVEL